jgi:hypothetical protein
MSAFDPLRTFGKLTRVDTMLLLLRSSAVTFNFNLLQFIAHLAWLTALWFGWGLFVQSRSGRRAEAWLYRQRSARYELRLEARVRAGEDRYFEELRSINANAPSPPTIKHAPFQNWPKYVALIVALALAWATDLHF